MTLASPSSSESAQAASDAVPFNNLSIQWNEIRGKALPDFVHLFEEGAFSLGRYVDAFERIVAEYLGTQNAIGVNSGTSALHLALIAAGVAPGDKVLVPSSTFIATAWAVLYVGASPVLCDVEADTANIDLEDAERRIDPKVKAIIPVHLYGQPANMRAVHDLASRHGLIVVEDAAQAIGAKYGGRHIGTIGALGCFSFYPGKNLGAAGEAGLIATDDARMARRLRALRNHGQEQRYLHAELGFNYRMDGLQGLVLSHKLPLIDGWTEKRKRLARAYDEQLRDLPLTLPRVVHGDHVFHLYVVRTDRRDALREFLLKERIESGLHYPIPLHRQPCLERFCEKPSSYPVSERYANECLSLPLYTGMTDAQLDRVCDSVRQFFRQS
jgi:dTDP-4-amino-4,6-dideoxygalactose transaminase